MPYFLPGASWMGLSVFHLPPWSLLLSKALRSPLFLTFWPNPAICFFYPNITLLNIVSKFRAQFGHLYWSSTWQSLSFFPLDRAVFDVAWKIADEVLSTADRVVSFGYDVPPLCLCGLASQSLPHLFFVCPLAQSVLSSLQSLMVTASPLCPSLLCRHVLFGFNPDELHCVPRIFILNVCKFYIWHAGNNFRFRDVPSSALDLIASVQAHVRFHLPFFSLFPLRPSFSLFPSSMGCQGCQCLPPAGPSTHSPLIF